MNNENLIEVSETGHKLKVLDHGYVILRNLAGPTRRATVPGFRRMGFINVPTEVARPFDADDTDVANAARQSFDNMDEGRAYQAEINLTRYLMKNHHDTPFESIVVWLTYKVPMFVARQFHRHRTQAINEVSGRYVQLPAEWYIPEVVGAKATDKKQGQVDTLSPLIQKAFKEDLEERCRESYRLYNSFLNDGVAPEHARMFLHLNHYTEYMSTVNLRNLLGFLLLRDHGHAQIEAQQYAKAIIRLLEPHLPGIMGVWEASRRGEL